MALLKCIDPECGKPVSSMATACPHCGAPTNQGSESNEDTNPIIKSEFEIRRDQLQEEPYYLNVILLDDEPNYPNSAIRFMFPDGRVFENLGKEHGSWIEYLRIGDPNTSGMKYFKYFTGLCHLDFGPIYVRWNDEAVYWISKIESLRYLRLPLGIEGVTKNGLRQLSKLHNLEFIQLPDGLGDIQVLELDEYHDPVSEVVRELQSCMPNAIVKGGRVR